MIQLIKQLRADTGAGVAACKSALAACDNDLAAATTHIQQQGLDSIDRRADRVTSEGRVMSYVHGEHGRIGVLLQVDCETDFVARGAAFREFMHEACLQIASMNPPYIDRDAVPATERNQAILAFELETEDKPMHITARIIEGKLAKWYTRICLVDQPWVRDSARTVGGLLADLTQSTGEHIVIRRFARFAAGA